MSKWLGLPGSLQFYGSVCLAQTNDIDLSFTVKHLTGAAKSFCTFVPSFFVHIHTGCGRCSRWQLLSTCWVLAGQQQQL